MRRSLSLVLVIGLAVIISMASGPAGARPLAGRVGLHPTTGTSAPSSNAPDFNGDGFADLAIGAPHDGAADGGVADAGGVNVVYGSAGGLETEDPPAQRWTQDIANVRGASAPGDLFGSSLAAADFNADGFTDLAIGVPGDPAGGVGGAGAVNVLYGTATGLQAVSPDDQLWSQAGQLVRDEPEAGDAFGAALAAADFNADGFADVAIGVPGEAVSETIPGAGSVAILYGTALGLQASDPDDQLWDQDDDGVRDKAEAGDAFGSSLTAGDFNQDGVADVAVGVPFEKVGGFAGAGATSVLYGSAGGIQADAPDDQIWHQDSTGVRDKAAAGESFGAAVAAGDFNDDGFDDLVNGVPGEKVGGHANAGAASVLYGTAGGLQAVSPDDQIWTQDSTGVQDSSGTNDTFGSSVATADFNGDGIRDLASGVPGEEVDGDAAAGSVSVLYGGGGGLQATSPDDQIWSQFSALVRGQPDPNERFGASVTGADFNGDGFDDLAAGVPGETVAGLFGAGAANVLYGSAGGIQAGAPDDQFWSQFTPGMGGEPGANEGMGSAVLGID